MAKTSSVVKTPKVQVMSPVTPVDEKALQNVYTVSDATSEAEIAQYDGLPGYRLEFDFVHFKRLGDEFVATLRAETQKAYWLSYGEWDSRVRKANLAEHEIGIDPMQKLLDRPRGTSNPLVRDQMKVQPRLPGYYVTWRIQGGEGDFEAAIESGFKAIRRPKDKEEEKTKSPLQWNGEMWKVRDGTMDPTSGEEIFNVMVCIEMKRWEDHLKAMSMISHNAYSANQQKFYEGADNISRDMLSSKERIEVSSLDEIHAEEVTLGKQR